MRSLLPLSALFLCACVGPWNPEWDLVEGETATPEETGDTDILLDTALEMIEVSGSITANTNWTSDKIYVLKDLVFVEGTARLSIEAGTTIYGDVGSALIITRDARIEARGQADAPIIFTSAKAVGSRKPGDWGGVVLLGNAPTNPASPQIEGVEEGDFRGGYGGNDPLSNCGVLEFVRIEFPGFEVFTDNELNGLTLGGCGTNTLIRNVQVHQTVDDGIEVFGGTVDLKNILITRAGDDSLDWDNGWTGRVQFLITQSEQVARSDGKRGDNGFESDSHEDTLPRSAPTIFNATMIGANIDTIPQRAMLLREGTAALMRNFIVQGYTLEGVDVRDLTTAVQAEGGALALTNSLFFDIGPGANAKVWAAAESLEEGAADNDDGGFDEGAWLSAAGTSNRLGMDPLLPQAAYNLKTPSFVPPANSPAATGAAVAPQGEFWDASANYLGAIRPGATVPWTAGWTAFPEN